MSPRAAAVAVSVGLAAGALVATPSVRRDLHGRQDPGLLGSLESQPGRIVLGIVGNALLPASLIVGAMLLRQPVNREPLLVAAGAVNAGYWAAKSVADQPPSDPPPSPLPARS